MAGVPESGDREGQPGAQSSGPEPEPASNDLVAQIRDLTTDDPEAVRQVVAEVLAALDRVTGAAFRDPLPEGPTPAGGSGT